MAQEKHEKKTPTFFCEKCDFLCNKQNEWERHIIRPKHTGLQKTPKKNTKSIHCEKCDFYCSRQSEWERHIITPKHNGTQKKHQKTHKKNSEYICTKCDKTYQHSSSLYKHSLKCYNDKNINDKNIIELLIKENIDFKNIVLDMVKNNNDLHQKHTDLQQQIIDICKNSSITNISNNNNHSNNKTFNLQVFLNEQCKDAMNMSDFINSFDLQLSDLETVGELGYVDGTLKLFLDRLRKMDIYKRPIHCSDAKREIIYVKDENVWTKEESDYPKIRKAIKVISFNTMKLVYNWSIAHPDCEDSEHRLNDTYIKLVYESSGGKGVILDSENKIIRRIAKEIIINKV